MVRVVVGGVGDRLVRKGGGGVVASSSAAMLCDDGFAVAVVVGGGRRGLSCATTTTDGRGKATMVDSFSKERKAIIFAFLLLFTCALHLWLG
jgi:hypothetical protein